MAMPAFNALSTKERLITLDESRQLLFGALCCERLLPNYIAFQKDTGWGDFSVVRNALDIVWKFLSAEVLTAQGMAAEILKCEAVTPSSDDFSSLYVTSAQDACFSVFCLLDYLVQADIEKIVRVAMYATDSVDLYVQEIDEMKPDDPSLEEKILTHRLMQRELTQQEHDLKAIELVTSLNKDFLLRCKSSWDNNGKSNLDIP